MTALTLRAAPRLGIWLELAQKAALCVLIVIVSFRFYTVLWEASAQITVLEEMRAFVLFLGDYALISLSLFSVFRLILDGSYRSSLLADLQALLEQGGVGWFVLLIWMGAGILWAKEPTLVRYGTLQMGAELCMMVVLAGFIRRGWTQTPCWALIAGTCAQSVLALAQTLHQGPLGLPILNESPLRLFSFYRPFGMTINPNNLAGYLMTGVFACLVLLRQQYQRRGLLLICGLVIGCGLIATQSRAAIAAAVVGLLFVGVRLRIRMKRRQWLILSAFVIVMGLWGGILLAGNYHDRFNLAQREFLFADTWAVLQRAPFLGVGVHNLVLAIAANHSGDAQVQLLLPAHNAYLMILAELGIPGLVLFLVSDALLVFRSWRSLNTAIIALGGCLLAVAVIMLFDFYYWDDHRSRTQLFWVVGAWWGYFLREKTIADST